MTQQPATPGLAAPSLTQQLAALMLRRALTALAVALAGRGVGVLGVNDEGQFVDFALALSLEGLSFGWSTLSLCIQRQRWWQAYFATPAGAAPAVPITPATEPSPSVQSTTSG